jgi:hypothetical protein
VGFGLQDHADPQQHRQNEHAEKKIPLELVLDGCGRDFRNNTVKGILQGRRHRYSPPGIAMPLLGPFCEIINIK